MRTNTAGGHGDGIDADGSLGGYYETDCFIEGDAAALATVVSFFRMTSSQGPARFDHFSRSGGNIKDWDYAMRIDDARIVNIDISAESRTDDTQVYAYWIVASASATQGGVEDANFRGTFGGLNQGGGVYIEDQKGGLGFQNISVTEVRAAQNDNSIAVFRTSGSGEISNVNVLGVSIGDFEPDTATTDAIILDGDIDEVLVDQITLTGRAGAANLARYCVYNNTASSKKVRIGSNILAIGDVATGTVFDPNIGDLSIGRFCALNTDGTPRRSYSFQMSADNVPASTSNGFMGQSFGGAAAAYWFDAPRRGRIIEVHANVLGTVTAGTLTIGGAPGGVIDGNLDVDFTSADGANPSKTVTYPAGSAAFAAGDPVQTRYTSDGSLTPTTLEASALVIFQEM